MTKQSNPSSATHDFGSGPVPAHQHTNGGGWVANTATVADTAYIGSSAHVFGDASVSGYARVYGNARVYGSASVFGDARVFGDASVSPLHITGFEYPITASDSTLVIGCKRMKSADTLTPDMFPEETCPRLREAAPEILVCIFAHWKRVARKTNT